MSGANHFGSFHGNHTGILVLGLGLKGNFVGLGLGSGHVWPWPCIYGQLEMTAHFCYRYLLLLLHHNYLRF